ncbi:ACP phosphodiesterase [Aridibaculum aurantiacum]|uniref:acyl carrier protein phosphodiesterase n=1 Tax=Aridibaculum aurantiacum TaxID=2810307 RepID=UPI001A962477|nr:ACP phosphodiesterase [Aridibaculum aurantiacum]
MNYLAHSYLSFDHHEVLVGNMISDFVKGKARYDFPVGVQKGITLHRAIDNFTDEHPATKEAKQFLKPAVGLYAGAFVDVAYDHFLANDELEFTDDLLQEHAASTYAVLENHEHVLPDRFKVMLPHMKSQNWLYNYRTAWGTEQSFGGVVRRARYLDSAAVVFDLFQKHYVQLQKCYKAFFPHLKAYAAKEFQLL